VRDEYRSASAPVLALLSRGENGAEDAPTLRGHFSVFNEWTMIDSAFEGRFLERVAPGAFARTIANDRARMRVLFQHGHDPMLGSKPLGTIQTLREDEQGAFYEVPLLDTDYVRELVPGLRAGVYGASFRFNAVRENFDNKPPRSTYNPDGLPERTITEARVMEFGPVTFGAYPSASAGVRSLSDVFATRGRG
jgi:HK97 family phage prohead protease